MHCGTFKKPIQRGSVEVSADHDDSGHRPERTEISQRIVFNEDQGRTVSFRHPSCRALLVESYGGIDRRGTMQIPAICFSTRSRS